MNVRFCCEWRVGWSTGVVPGVLSWPACLETAMWQLLHAEQSADRIEGGGHMHVGVGVHPAGNGACLYDGQCHPFPEVERCTHLLAVGPVTSRPLARATQIRPAAPVGA